MDKWEGIILGVDVMDLINFIEKKQRRFQATTLNQIEQVITDPEQFSKVRKIYLDSSNTLIRTVIKVIFGDIERG